jgi:DNA mismatch repair ATPase MutS
MDCLVHGEDGEESTSATTKGKAALKDEMPSEQVTFLYKLCDGSSPKSYGINVARLAGMPSSVIQLALKQSSEFEEKSKNALEMNGLVSKISAVFERLVSIANAKLTLEELVNLTVEIWKRYNVMKHYIS